MGESGRLRRSIAGLALAILVPAAIRAEPYMAVRYGMTCSQCHINPTGGGGRSRFGSVFAQTELPVRTVGVGDLERIRDWLRPSPPPEAAPAEPTAPAEGEDQAAAAPSGLRQTYFDGRIGEVFSVGADFRFALRAAIPRSGPSTASLDVTEGNLYGSAAFLDDIITLYLDEKVAPGGASAREAFGMLRGPWGTWLKAGRILLPYGIRLQDDAAFIREDTGFNFGVQDLGVELGAEPGPFSGSIAISNGTGGTSDDDRNKQVTGSLAFIQRHWRIGAQGSWNDGEASRRAAAGGNAGLSFGRFALLGEADYLVDEIFGPAGSLTHSVILYGEVDYLLAKGVNLKFTYDWEKPDSGESRNAFSRVGGGVEVFPTQFTQVRLLAHYRDEADRSGKVDTVLVTLEFHLYF